MPVKAKENFQVVIRFDEPLDLLEGVNFVKSPKCGAINTFSGTVRDTDIKGHDSSHSCPATIEALHYEAYESMAEKQISDILEETINSPNLGSGDPVLVDPNSRAFVAVRLGRVLVGETSIIICVSSTSRTCSHRATMVVLERIKALVVIWKKILFADGHEEWADPAKSEAIWLKKRVEHAKATDAQ